MARFVLAYNPSDAPVQVDLRGRTIGGGEWGPVQSTADALADGRLVKVDLPRKSEGTDPDARAAAARVDELNDRQSHFNGMDVDELLALVRGTGAIGPDATRTKADLVDLAVHSGVPIDTSTPSYDPGDEVDDAAPAGETTAARTARRSARRPAGAGA
jgi:hypothetical protein